MGLSRLLNLGAVTSSRLLKKGITTSSSRSLPTPNLNSVNLKRPTPSSPGGSLHSRRKMATHAPDVHPQDFGNFKLLQSFPIKYAPVEVAKWRSEKTGLTVVVGSHAAPVVRGSTISSATLMLD